MNFNQAIEAHVNWKSKLAKYIAKPNHTLNAATVSQEANCDLGKWLKGEGARFATTPEFTALIQDHARFHKAAGEIIQRADAGQCVSEEIALGARSEYASASNAVVGSLMRMKMKVAA
jgi:hypothetical protein